MLDSLRHFVQAMGVYGFRFDLATVLGREAGLFNPDAVLTGKIYSDPLLRHRVLVAEPWDMGPGGYALGQFGKPFREHNDTLPRRHPPVLARRHGKIGPLAAKPSGSAEIFSHAGRKPTPRGQLPRRP
ncbi:hypothetical protein [Paracoccus sp. (in: a-proteobacteria)]|uniref:hypothetical protein n=1 Tax=Paracoccus sp. TaxID=267 RepID=UPI002AFDF3DD|nr:hypothetical protein [Paracoccus sp. (in: a-proteobacteria)]